MNDVEVFAETVGAAVVRHQSGEITDANSATEEHLGYRSSELIGQAVSELFPDPEMASAGNLHPIKNLPEHSPVETSVVDPDGKTHRVEIRANEMVDSDETLLVFRRLKERTQREQYLRFAQDVTELIVQAEDEPSLLQSIIDTITARQFGCTSIALLNQVGDLAEIYGTMEEWCEMSWASVYTPEYIDAVLDRDELVIEDTTKGPYRQHEVESMDHGAIALALSHRGQEYGILTLHLPAKGSSLSGHERALLRELADNIATGIHNLRIEAELRDRQTQLTVLGRVLRHNLRNELSVIIAVGETLERTLSGNHDEQVGLIPERSQALLALAEEQREIVELIAEPPEVRPVDLSSIVDRTVNEFASAYPDVTITVTAPENVSALAIPQIERAVEELIENGIVHNNKDEPNVSIQVTQRESNISIAIVDNGPGIPDQEIAVLTRKRAIDQLDHGSGLALWLVNWIVKLSDGEIQFDEPAAGGSVVTITLQGPSAVG